MIAYLRMYLILAEIAPKEFLYTTSLQNLMDIEDEIDTLTIFAPEPGGVVVKLKSFDDFLKFFSQRYVFSTP